MNRPEQADVGLSGDDHVGQPIRVNDPLDRFCDACERVMPDLSMLGAMLLLVLAALAATDTTFDVSDEVLGPMSDAANAASDAGVIAAY